MNTSTIFLPSLPDKNTAERVNSDLIDGLTLPLPSDGAWVALSGISASAHSLYVKLLLLSADSPDEPVNINNYTLAALMNLSRGDKVAKYMAELTRIGAVVVIRGGMPRKSSYLVRRQPPAGYDGPLKITDWTASFGEVVYYVRRASGDIKIGTTAGPALHRVAQLRRVHGDVDILATEPGGVDVEEHRHRQFAAERLDGEWFRPGAHLLAHIATLAGTPLRVGGGL